MTHILGLLPLGFFFVVAAMATNMWNAYRDDAQYGRWNDALMSAGVALLCTCVSLLLLFLTGLVFWKGIPN